MMLRSRMIGSESSSSSGKPKFESESSILGRGRPYEGPVRELVLSILTPRDLLWSSVVVLIAGVVVSVDSAGISGSFLVERDRLAGRGTAGRDARPASAYISGNLVLKRSRKSVEVLPCFLKASSLQMVIQDGPCSLKPLRRAWSSSSVKFRLGRR
jgi:hypothetical protein